MTLVETQNAGNAFVVIRGISQARNSEPSVAVLVDGVLETNPAEFNQELFDIQQIEVLKGPQGALYGRNAIGGAIIIHTKEPGDEFEGRVKLGYGNEISVRAQAGISGPMGDTLKYRACVSYYDTDGFLPSTFLGGKADPVESLSARLRLMFEAERYVLGRRASVVREPRHARLLLRDPARRRGESLQHFTTPPDANDVTSPIQVDQTGVDNRDLLTGAVRLNFDLGGGTLTSVTAYNTTEEIITGDAFDFRPGGRIRSSHALLGLRPQPEPVPRSSTPGARRCASPRPMKGASAGSSAATSCTPTGSSPPATWSMTAPACSRSTTSRA